MQAVDACELGDRLRMVVGSQVDKNVGQARIAAVAFDDQEGRGLLAPAIAARRLGCCEALEQALGERPPRGSRECRRERGDGLLADEDVPLGRVARAGSPAGPVHALRAGEAGAASVRVDDAELAVVAAVVGGGQARDDLLGGQSLAEECKAVRAVAGVRVRLGRDRSHVWLRPRHDRADGEKLRLRRDTPLACLEVARGDRVGGDDRHPVSHR